MIRFGSQVRRNTAGPTNESRRFVLLELTSSQPHFLGTSSRPSYGIVCVWSSTSWPLSSYAEDFASWISSRVHAKSSYGKRRMPGSLIQLETQVLETQLLFNPTVGRWVGLDVSTSLASFISIPTSCPSSQLNAKLTSIGRAVSSQVPSHPSCWVTLGRDTANGS